MRIMKDMRSRDNSLPEGLRWPFAILLAVLPNAIALFAFFVVLVESEYALFAIAYCLSLPGAFIISQWGSESMAVGITALLLNILVDAWIAYQAAALRNRWLRVGLLAAYVAISRSIAL